MKILWVMPAPIGPSGRILGMAFAGSSGGWIQTSFEAIRQDPDAELVLLCASPKIPVGKPLHRKSEEGEAFCVHRPRLSSGIEATNAVKRDIQQVIAQVRPDVVQIWGTETCIQHAAAECAEGIPTVIFLQGLIGMHDRYQSAHLKALQISFPKRPKEFLISKLMRYCFRRQIRLEQDAIRRSGHVILDSDFATAYCQSLSREIHCYHYHLDSNNVFAEKRWSLETCRRNRVFTLYGGTPDKGLQQLLRAAAIVRRSVPDLQVVIPGSYHIKEGGHLADTGLSAYERLMKKLIQKNGLEENVFFCGQLTAQGMAEAMRESHMFVNPSCMEVHAGTLREAMTVGVPSVSSYCGSVGEYVREGENGFLYRYEEHEVLAYKMLRLLTDDALAAAIGAEGRKTMLSHRNDANGRSLMKIYREILATESAR